MPNDTFGQLWNRVLLYAPDLPPPLAREFVKNTYRLVLDNHYWSELRVDAEFLIPDNYSTGTVSVINGSPSVVGNGTAFNGTHFARQLSVGSIAPWYTIKDVTSGTSLTLDRPYGGISGTYAYTIGQFYVEFPLDLHVLEKIRDQQNGWYLVTQWYTIEYLDRVDAKRMSTGTPVIAVAAPPRIASNGGLETLDPGTVVPRYELWPRSNGIRAYEYRYRKNASLDTDDTAIITGVQSDVLIYGALRQAALWPGTADKPNPHFSQELHATYTKLYEDALNYSIKNDLDVNQQMVQIGDDITRRFPFDAKYLQDHIW